LSDVFLAAEKMPLYTPLPIFSCLATGFSRDFSALLRRAAAYAVSHADAASSDISIVFIFFGFTRHISCRLHRRRTYSEPRRFHLRRISAEGMRSFSQPPALSCRPVSAIDVTPRCSADIYFATERFSHFLFAFFAESRHSAISSAITIIFWLKRFITFQPP